ncbi:unnamed protein product [Ilex paraguariensis]|uniref:PI4-kinase N-terminal domain-containing protein n=1 Tax=Ilex paraguariensis TaxID=185542 RepID=A0ABC8S3S8_9AQUA
MAAKAAASGANLKLTEAFNLEGNWTSQHFVKLVPKQLLCTLRSDLKSNMEKLLATSTSYLLVLGFNFHGDAMETGVFIWTSLVWVARLWGSLVLAELVDALWTIGTKTGLFASEVRAPVPFIPVPGQSSKFQNGASATGRLGLALAEESISPWGPDGELCSWKVEAGVAVSEDMAA